MGILNDHEEREIIAGKALDVKESDFTSDVDTLLHRYCLIGTKLTHNMSAIRFRQLARELVADVFPLARSVSTLSKVILQFPLPQDQGETGGFESLFLSACIQQAYDCGENNFTWNASSWGKDRIPIPYELVGTSKNPLTLDVLVSEGHSGLIELRHCNITIHDSSRDTLKIRHVYSSKVSILGDICPNSISQGKNTSFYLHNPSDFKGPPSHSISQCKFYVPSQLVETYKEFFGCERGNTIHTLEDNHGNT